MTSFTPTKTIADVVPEARPHFEELLRVATSLGMQPKIISAGRTCADQDALYSGGPAVTKAPGCRSWHVLGRALDLSLKPDACATYTKLGEIWEGMGGIWGGRFPGFGACGDAGHFQWAETGAVPQSICPRDADCDAVREAYLAEAFAQPLGTVARGKPRSGWVKPVAVIVAGVVIWRWFK